MTPNLFDFHGKPLNKWIQSCAIKMLRAWYARHGCHVSVVLFSRFFSPSLLRGPQARLHPSLFASHLAVRGKNRRDDLGQDCCRC